MRTRLLGLLAVLTLGAGCEGAIAFRGVVSVASHVAPTSGGQAILMLINDDYRYPLSDQPGMWGDKAAGLYAVSLYADTGTSTVAPTLRYEPARSSYPYIHDEFAYYPSKVWLGVFIDENNSGLLDVGEPVGISSQNPLVDLPGHGSVDSVVVDFQIDHRLLPGECVWLNFCAPSRSP